MRTAAKLPASITSAVASLRGGCRPAATLWLIRLDAFGNKLAVGALVVMVLLIPSCGLPPTSSRPRPTILVLAGGQPVHEDAGRLSAPIRSRPAIFLSRLIWRTRLADRGLLGQAIALLIGVPQTRGMGATGWARLCVGSRC